MEFQELIRDFLVDAEGHLASFDAALLSLEGSGLDSRMIVNTLGTLHTLKGNAGMMGFESLKNYIHHTEGILKKIQQEGSDTGDILTRLFHSANVIRHSLMEIGKDPSSNPDLAAEIIKIQRDEDPETASEKKHVDIAAYLGSRSDTIKVDFKKLDDLLDLVGEMVIYKTRLEQVEGRIREILGSKAVAKDLKEGLEGMGKTVSGIQEGIMRARMLPVGHVFSKFTRMVRDIAKAHGKEIRLSFKGDDTELDKSVIDELEEPLLHILRNAVDHGIELPRQRIEQGKDRQGVIELSASQESSHVIITVADDGRGIHTEEIRECAIRAGLLKPDEMVDSEKICSLVFSPGFTTKKEATDISGRGIGLDVVHKSVSKLNGQVTVKSSWGEGTMVTMKLPLSLAIIPALMTEAAGDIYAIPMTAVDEGIKVGEEEIHLINNREVIRFRERVLPVVRLNDFLGLGGDRKKRMYMVIMGQSDRRLAMAVDRLIGRQEIVIKPLDDTLGKSYGIAGASILGNGRIVLVLDVMALWNRSAMPGA